MDDLLDYAERLMAYISTQGGSLNQETQQALGQLLQNIFVLIEEQQQNPVDGMPPTAPPEPELNPSMPSSNINSFSYDDKTGNLLVKFQGDYPQENGPIYSYGGVPKQIFDLFQKGAVPARTDGKNAWGKWWKGKAPSMGASMYTLIKGGNYPYQKIS